MKKTISLLAALMLVVMLLPATAMAYAPVTPGENSMPTLSAKHTLTLTNPDLNSLPYDIKYSFTLSDFKIVQPTDISNASNAINNTNAVTINPITYTTSDVFDQTSKSLAKDLTVNWGSGDTKLQIMEPGIYRWKVTKSVETTAPDADKTSTTSYLYVYAYDNGGELTIGAVNMTTDEALSQKAPPSDQYPIKTVNLSIGKTVTGNQGSKDQYFKFDITLDFPTTVTADYDITADNSNTSYDSSVPATAYNNSVSNPTKINVNNTSHATVSLWLKHGQVAKINDLLYGTSYTITETPSGYTVSSITQTDSSSGAVLTPDNYEASDASLTADNTITFTNDKSIAVPTGITLNTAAPVMGILLAMSLLAVLYIGKRKEYQV